MRLFRRSVGSFADPHWFRFVEGDPEWNSFTKHLWDLQLVKKPVPLSAESSATLYRYTQGIPDLLVKPSNSAQQFAMNEGVEELSPQLLEQVARKELMAGNLRLIEAIRKQDDNKLGQIEDVHPLDVINPGLSDDLRAAAEAEILKSRDLEYDVVGDGLFGIHAWHQPAVGRRMFAAGINVPVVIDSGRIFREFQLER